MVVDLPDEVAMLLRSIEGDSALSVLLPLWRELAMHIAGRGQMPEILKPVPGIGSTVALERARYRAEKSLRALRNRKL